MTQKRWFLLGILLVACAVALTLVYEEALREHVLRPMLYELWLWGLRLGSLTNLIWFIFLVIASLSVYMSVIDGVILGRSPAESPETASRLGPVATLGHKIKLACQGELARWNMHRILSDVAISLIALRESVTEGEARQYLKNGDILSELRLSFEFPVPATRWAWLSGRLAALNPVQRRSRLQEIAYLVEVLERFAEEGYGSASKHRGQSPKDS